MRGVRAPRPVRWKATSDRERTETVEPIDHPPGHEIERLSKEIEERYGEDELEPRQLLDWISPSQEAAEPDSEDDPQTSLWQPDLTGTEMIERDSSLTGAAVLEIKLGIQSWEPDDDDILF
jgi:hypothetical protein